jgi:hypothetical protein
MDYLLKTEPSVYSFSDLQRDKNTVWDGVTNPVAVKHLRELKAGDRLVIYHTGDEKSGDASAGEGEPSLCRLSAGTTGEAECGSVVRQPVQVSDRGVILFQRKSSHLWQNRQTVARTRIR